MTIAYILANAEGKTPEELIRLLLSFEHETDGFGDRTVITSNDYLTFEIPCDNTYIDCLFHGMVVEIYNGELNKGNVEQVSEFMGRELIYGTELPFKARVNAVLNDIMTKFQDLSEDEVRAIIKGLIGEEE